ncbi:uncharacterized protein LOC135821400 [Sycon ciliatum]|uniref:uncharacterized protein LOC135821400 n=1 Tax=Sycon ciliatum TaxID=27933 RepID=UPI0031F64867
MPMLALRACGSHRSSAYSGAGTVSSSSRARGSTHNVMHVRGRHHTELPEECHIRHCSPRLRLWPPVMAYGLSTCTVRWLALLVQLFVLVTMVSHGSVNAQQEDSGSLDRQTMSAIMKDLALNHRDVDSTHGRTPARRAAAGDGAASMATGARDGGVDDVDPVTAIPANNRRCSKRDATRVSAQCALQCRCIAGRWKCCRLRKSYEELSEEEKQRLVDAYLLVSQDKRYKREFSALVWSHAVFACQMVRRDIDLYPTIVPFHRLLLIALENLLRRVDCRITMPFWDIPKHYTRSWADQPPLRDKHLFGSDGSGPDHCVRDGDLAEGKYTTPLLQYRGVKLPLKTTCLRRNLDDSSAPCPWPVVQAILSVPSSDAALLMAGLLGGFDVLFHYGIGGSLRDVSLPIDPIFAMAHSYTDKLIATYQAVGSDFLSGHGYFNNTQRLTAFPWFSASDFMDASNLPGGVCLAWGASMSRDEAIATGYYAAMEMPRSDYLQAAYSKVRDQQLDGGARSAKAFQTVLDYFAQHFPSFKFDASGFHIHDWQAALHAYARRPRNKQHYALQVCADILKVDPQFLSLNVTSPGMRPA